MWWCMPVVSVPGSGGWGIIKFSLSYVVSFESATAKQWD